jgi:hypothetical protein
MSYDATNDATNVIITDFSRVGEDVFWDLNVLKAFGKEGGAHAT